MHMPLIPQLLINMYTHTPHTILITSDSVCALFLASTVTSLVRYLIHEDDEFGTNNSIAHQFSQPFNIQMDSELKQSVS